MAETTSHSLILGKDIRQALDWFRKELLEEHLSGLEMAKRTLRLLRIVVSSVFQGGYQRIEESIRQVGRELSQIEPHSFVAENVTRRVLKVIREEDQSIKVLDDALDGSESSQMAQLSDTQGQFRKRSKHLRNNIMEAINEIEEEFDAILANIGEQSLEHIHASEVLLTFGYSQSVEEFLKVAAEKRNFQVIIAECELDYSGHKLAKNLCKESVDVTLISDAAVFALMSRVHKVVIGAHAIMADGSVLSATGSFAVAAAAKYFAVPVVICTGLHKLTPLFPHQPDILYDILSPCQIIQESDMMKHKYWYKNLEITSTKYDLIPSQYISLFVTNSGGFSPSYLYRLLGDFYDDIDTAI
eukprot:jgi/Galph1/4410/GphlegSOOS_G3066.1